MVLIIKILNIIFVFLRHKSPLLHFKKRLMLRGLLDENEAMAGGAAPS
jgi:hypothetical protein